MGLGCCVNQFEFFEHCRSYYVSEGREDACAVRKGYSSVRISKVLFQKLTLLNKGTTYSWF